MTERLHVLSQTLHAMDLCTQELSSVLRALRGSYVLPEAGGDLLRDGAGVLPTGVTCCE